MTMWFEVYSDTIKPHREDNNLSMIHITRGCADDYRTRYCPEFETLEDFENNHSAEDTTNLFNYALNRREVFDILWQSYDLENDDAMVFSIRELENIASVPEEELPKWLRDFIAWNYSEMGFMDSYDCENLYLDKEGELKEQYFRDVERVLTKYPQLECSITYEYGLTTYINTGGIISWKR